MAINIDNKKVTLGQLKSTAQRLKTYVDNNIPDVSEFLTEETFTQTEADALYSSKSYESKVDTLIGSDANKSVRTIATEELAVQLIPENAHESLTTLQELAAWIHEHPEDVSSMNEDIQKKYEKPSTGIPLSDLSESVQTSLSKADSALQEHQSLDNYYTKTEIDGKNYVTEHQSLENYYTKTEINEKNYLTEHQDISGKQDKLTDSQLANLDLDHSQYLTEHQSLDNYYTKTEIDEAGYITDISGKADVDHNHDDIYLKEEQYTGTYSKPEGGIPLSDLAESVQNAITSGTPTDISTATDSDINSMLVELGYKTRTISLTSPTVSGTPATQYISSAPDFSGLTFKVKIDDVETDVTQNVVANTTKWSSTIGTQTATWSYTYTEDDISASTTFTKTFDVSAWLSNPTIEGSMSEQTEGSSVDTTGLTFKVNVKGVETTVTPTLTQPSSGTWESSGEQTAKWKYEVSDSGAVIDSVEFTKTVTVNESITTFGTLYVDGNEDATVRVSSDNDTYSESSEIEVTTADRLKTYMESFNE